MRTTGYEIARVNLLPDEPSYAAHKKAVSEAVGAETVAVNVYTALPGESISLGYHRHPKQEEMFYVVDGTIAFETEDGGFWVEAGEVFFVPADAPHRCRAAGETAARVIAIGAPKASSDVIFTESCPACGEDTDREIEGIDSDPEVLVLRCTACQVETDRVRPGMEIEADPCPECGETVRTAEELIDDDGRTTYILQCIDCGSETERIRDEVD